MNLLIVGAGGHGRCCLDIAREMNSFDKIAFLDDKLVNSIINDAKVIGTVDEMSSYYPEYTNICIAIGNNKSRHQLMCKAKKVGYALPILRSESSVISKYAEVGMGCVIFPNTVIEANAVVKEGCIIASNSVVNHDAQISHCSLIYSNTVIRPNTHIGEYSRIGSNCTISFGTELNEESDIEDGKTI